MIFVSAVHPADVRCDWVPQLVVVHQGSRLLLGKKKRGFGEGYYNGFGGKVEAGESIDEAASREVNTTSPHLVLCSSTLFTNRRGRHSLHPFGGAI